VREGCLRTVERRRRDKSASQDTKTRRRARDTHGLSNIDGGKCQDTERKREGEGDSRTVKRTRRDKSGPRKSERARGTHSLSSTDGEAGQGTNTKRESKGHPQTVEYRRMDKLRHQDKARKRGALTLCEAQTEQVRKPREHWRAMRTHFLSKVNRGIYQDTNIMQEGERNSLPGERRWRAESGHQERAR
jgi:hypothetical protein